MRMSQCVDRVLQFFRTQTLGLAVAIDPNPEGATLDDKTTAYYQLLVHSESIEWSELRFLLLHIDDRGLVKLTAQHRDLLELIDDRCNSANIIAAGMRPSGIPTHPLRASHCAQGQINTAAVAGVNGPRVLWRLLAQFFLFLVSRKRLSLEQCALRKSRQADFGSIIPSAKYLPVEFSERLFQRV